MKVVYALLYDIGDGAAELSGIYTSLAKAKSAVNVTEWKELEGAMGSWEGCTDIWWYIEAHALQD
jgi:hypothetical protein